MESGNLHWVRDSVDQTLCGKSVTSFFVANHTGEVSCRDCLQILEGERTCDGHSQAECGESCLVPKESPVGLAVQHLYYLGLIQEASKHDCAMGRCMHSSPEGCLASLRFSLQKVRSIAEVASYRLRVSDVAKKEVFGDLKNVGKVIANAVFSVVSLHDGDLLTVRVPVDTPYNLLKSIQKFFSEHTSCLAKRVNVVVIASKDLDVVSCPGE